MTLNNGTKIPVIGLGTFRNKDETRNIVKSAVLEHGYRHIDTAKVYENEPEIGEALQEIMAAGVTREELYITTKLWSSDYNDIEGACRTSLEKLKLDYVDCYMVHWMILPIDFESEDWKVTSPPFHIIWQQMEQLVKKGLAKSIAVSNCTIPMMMNLLAGCEIKPVMNQIEIHPYMNQNDVIRFHKKWGVALECYAPIGGQGGSVLDDAVISEIAAAKGRTNAQVVIAWHLKRGTIPLTKTSRVERLPENINVSDIELTEEEFAKIEALNKNLRMFDPI